MSGQSDLNDFFDFNNAAIPQNDFTMESIESFDYNALGALDHAMAFSTPGMDDR